MDKVTVADINDSELLSKLKRQNNRADFENQINWKIVMHISKLKRLELGVWLTLSERHLMLSQCSSMNVGDCGVSVSYSESLIKSV